MRTTALLTIPFLLAACSDPAARPTPAGELELDVADIGASPDLDEASLDLGAADLRDLDAAADLEGADDGVLDSAADAALPPPCEEPPGAIFVAPGGRAGATGEEDDPLGTLSAAMSRAMAGDTVVLRGGRYAEALEFVRSGEPGRPITVRAACGEQPVLDGAGLGVEGLVMIRSRAHLVVEGLTLKGLTASRASVTPAGVWVRGESKEITIRGNTITGIRAYRDGEDSGAHGIAVYGTARGATSQITIEGNTLHDMRLGWSEALVVNGNVRDFKVIRNIVYDVDNIAYDFIGFEPDICEACDQGDELEGEALNRARRGLVAENVAYDVSSYGNPAYGDTKAAGCFYVDGGAQITIERNVAYRCDIGVELASEWPGKSTRAIIVRDNLLYHHDVTGIATGGYDDGSGPGGGSARDCAVVHNTIVDSSRSGWAETGLLLQNRNVNNRYQNNIIVSTASHQSITVAGARNEGNIFGHNLTRGPLDGLAPGAGWQTGDPRFVDAARPDLRLMPGSPALRAGTPLPQGIGAAVDHDGSPRDAAAPTMGALEP
jgi:hypothetical protein